MRISKIPSLLLNLLVLGFYYAWASVLWSISKNPLRRRKRGIRFTSVMCRIFLKTLHINVTTEGLEKLRALKNTQYLLVSNHVSYTDILVLSSLENLVFITSVEMGNNRILGGITRVGGCLYTERRKPVSLPKEIQRFAHTIKEGFKVVLFPEGTSTDGRTVKDFRSSLFQVALSAKADILPVCIKYTSIDGKAMDDSNRDTVCWYGDMEFAPHLINLLGHRIEVRVSVLDPITYDEKQSRAELSEHTRQLLLDTFHS